MLYHVRSYLNLTFGELKESIAITTVVKIIFDVKPIQISLGSGGEGREEEINHNQVEFFSII